MRKDHVAVQTPDRRRFTSVDDALLRLIPYHVFQGAPPSPDEFSQGTVMTILDSPQVFYGIKVVVVFNKSSVLCFEFPVDEEFEAAATQVLMRTQGMVNKYRRLLMVEAEVGAHAS